MLSVYGLVILASEVTKQSELQYSTVLEFEAASDDHDGKMRRHYINLFVPKDKVLETKEKLRVGAVCEIIHANWSEYLSKYSLENPSAIRYTKTTLKVELKNFKILAPCIYHEDVEAVTITQKE